MKISQSSSTPPSNSKRRKVIIFGAGGTGQTVYSRICKDYDVIAFCDNDIQKQNKMLYEVPIIAPFDLDKVEFDYIFVGTDMRDSVYHQVVRQLGISPDVLLDEPIKLAMYKARRMALLNAKSMIETRKLKGNVAEAGVFQGEFASKINEAFPDRTLYLFDTFDGFDERDIIEEDKSVYASKNEMNNMTSPDYVLSIMPHKEQCIIRKGYFPSSADGINDSFVFVSLDMDLYKPTIEGLKFFYPRLVKGGFIFIHDFFGMRFSGVEKAVTEYAQSVDLSLAPLGDDCTIIVTK